MEATPAKGIFWIRSNAHFDTAALNQKDIILSLGGIFSAEIYWNGNFIGRKGVIQNAADESPNPFLFTLRLDQELIKNGSNTLALRIQGDSSSFFTSKPIQVLSLNAIEYSEADAFIYNFMLGAFFLSFLFILVMCSLTYLRESEQNKKSGLLVLATVFLMANYLLMVLSGLPVIQLDTLILLLVFTSTASLGVYLLILEREFGEGTLRGLYFSLLFAVIVISSMFVSKDLIIIYSLPQIVFYLILLARTLAWKRAGLAIGLGSVSGLLIVPILAFYKPYFMASYGIYIFAGVYTLPPAVKLFRKVVKAFIARKQKKYLDLYSKGQKRLVAVEDIQALTAVGHYTEVTLKDAQKHIYQHGLAELLDRLPENFIRIHRSHAINIKFMDALLTDSGSKYNLRLKTGEMLPVGRKYLKKLDEVLV